MKFARLNANVFQSKRKFYDDKHFPYGFHRSGDFSIAEADLLSDCGLTMSQLVSGKIEPSSAEQERFINVVSGEAEPQYFEESVYLKYMRLIKERERNLSPHKKVQTNQVQEEDEGSDDDDFI